MASKMRFFTIMGGPSLLDLLFAIGDFKHPRLLLFRLEEEGRKGNVEVQITGITQDMVGGRSELEEWILAGWFMCDGLKTVVRDLIHFEARYDTRSRRGQIYSKMRTIGETSDVVRGRILANIIRWE